MRGKKNARPAVGAAEQAVKKNVSSAIPHEQHSTILNEKRQCFISDLLTAGSQNGLKLRDLVSITGYTEREVRMMIAAERHDGIPILSDNANGYFLPENKSEVMRCVRSLRHRAAEIVKAADAIEQAVV